MISLACEKRLTCHICGLLIYEKAHLTFDHAPIPKSQGGTEILPAHFWCNQAKADSHMLRSIRLEGLLHAWESKGRIFPEQAEDSLIVLKWKEAAIIASAQNIK
jgi:hypothetical protein